MLVVVALFNGACAHRTRTLANRSAKNESSPVAFSSSFKTTDGKVSQQEGQSSQSKPENSTEGGKCIFGCQKTDPSGLTKESKKASLETSPSIPQTPGSAGSQTKEVSPDYILGSEDIIDVLVWKNENLSKTVTIRPDGKISLPLIGDVQAAGLTTAQLRESIREKLKDFKESPEVSIIVREINSLVIYITGEVVHPGKLMLRSNTSLLQALIMAGGFTQFAVSNQIVLLRRVGGIETRKVIRYKDIVSGRRPGDNLILLRGDTIVVP